jgi:rare lipoprotein A
MKICTVSPRVSRGTPLAAAMLGLGLSAVTGNPASAEGVGIASFYGGRLHGGPTASGERFNQNAMTAAHRSYPLGSRVKVTNLNNGKTVMVRINDRGPFVRGRIIDVSRGAAAQLGFIASGLAKVRVERVGANADAAEPVRMVER